LPGLYFEQFEAGQRFEHLVRRTVTETDNLLFSALTMNPAALHLDAEYANSTPYGQRVVNSVFTLGLLVGLTVYDTTYGTTLGNLGWEDVKFPRPVFIGDTLHAVTTVISKRESQSRPDSGIVIFDQRAYNQRDEEVASCRRAALMMKRLAHGSSDRAVSDRAVSEGTPSGGEGIPRGDGPAT
jgi:acyl dehydratase